MAPVPYRVAARRRETHDTVTLLLRPYDPATAIATPEPGQFTMLYAFGVGESAISVSGLDGEGIEQTIRAVGAVSTALTEARPGDVVGVRGPYGTGWNVGTGGRDLLFAAGGIGLAPLRPAIHEAVARRSVFGRVTLLVGARTPGDLPYLGELAELRDAGVDLAITVDRAAAGWTGNVGVITTLLDGLAPDLDRTTAYVCGPEIMIRLTAAELARRGVPDVRVSLERNMRCGLGWCGHCQLGSILVCRDGPVVAYPDVAGPLAVKEL